MATAPDMQVDVLTSMDDIERQRRVLTDILVRQPEFHPMAAIDYYAARIAGRENILKPFCVMARRNDAVKAVLLGYIEKTKEAVQRGLGYRKLIGIPVRCLHIVAGGCFLDLNTDELRTFSDHLLKTMKREFDVIRIDSFRPGYAVLRLYRQGTFPDAVIRQNSQCRADVSADYDSFYSRRSKNTRHNLRKREKQLLKQFDESDIELKIYTRTENMDTALEDIERIARNTYQRKMSVGFFKDRETRTIYKKMAAQNALYAFVLYIKGMPCSFHTGMVFNGIFHGLTKGYDQDYADYNVGHYLFIKMIQHLCNVDGIDYYDFGIGDSYYKNQVSDIKLAVFQAKLFAPGMRGRTASYISRADLAFKAAVRVVRDIIRNKK